MWVISAFLEDGLELRGRNEVDAFTVAEDDVAGITVALPMRMGVLTAVRITLPSAAGCAPRK